MSELSAVPFHRRFLNPVSTFKEWIRVSRDCKRLAGGVAPEQLSGLHATRSACRNVLLLWLSLSIGGVAVVSLCEYLLQQTGRKSAEDGNGNGAIVMLIESRPRNEVFDREPESCLDDAQRNKAIELLRNVGFEQAEAKRLHNGICALPHENSRLVENVFIWATALRHMVQYPTNDENAKDIIERLVRFFLRNGRARLWIRMLPFCEEGNICYERASHPLTPGTFYIDSFERMLIGREELSGQQNWMQDHDMSYFDSRNNTLYLPNLSVDEALRVDDEREERPNSAAIAFEDITIFFGLKDAYTHSTAATMEAGGQIPDMLTTFYKLNDIIAVLDPRIPAAVERFIMEQNQNPLVDTSPGSVANAVAVSVQRGFGMPLKPKQLNQLTYIVVRLLKNMNAKDHPQLRPLWDAFAEIVNNPQEYFILSSEKK